MQNVTSRQYRVTVENDAAWVEYNPFTRWASPELVARMAALPDANHRKAVEQEAHYCQNVIGGRFSGHLLNALALVEAGEYSRLTSGRVYLDLVGDDVCRSCNKIGDDHKKYAILFEMQGRFVDYEEAPLCATCGNTAEQSGQLKGRTFEKTLLVKTLGTQPEFWSKYAKKEVNA